MAIAPELVIEQPAGTAVAAGAVKYFGIVNLDSFADLGFIVRNAGGAPLASIAISIDGDHAGEFSVSIPPAAVLAPGARTGLTLRFHPAGAGWRRATLHLAAADSTVDLHLTGTGYAWTDLASHSAGP